jgi:hypothetical protein
MGKTLFKALIHNRFPPVTGYSLLNKKGGHYEGNRS